MSLHILEDEVFDLFKDRSLSHARLGCDHDELGQADAIRLIVKSSPRIWYSLIVLRFRDLLPHLAPQLKSARSIPRRSPPLPVKLSVETTPKIVVRVFGFCKSKNLNLSDWEHSSHCCSGFLPRISDLACLCIDLCLVLVKADNDGTERVQILEVVRDVLCCAVSPISYRHNWPAATHEFIGCRRVVFTFNESDELGRPGGEKLLSE